MDEYTAYLLEALENAETEEERHDLIIKCLRHRPDVKHLMAELILMERQEQAQAANLFIEILKPRSGQTA